jgi:uncharacterized membrane protein YgcG
MGRLWSFFFGSDANPERSLRGAASKKEAVALIQRLDLKKAVARAVTVRQTLIRAEAQVAEEEYRQFLLLIWINQTMSSREYVVPSKRADAIWHEHILDSASYRAFSEALVGKYIDHNPGLEPGTERFNRAVQHTKKLHRDHGNDGFTPSYLASCGSATPMFIDTGHSGRSNADDHSLIQHGNVGGHDHGTNDHGNHASDAGHGSHGSDSSHGSSCGSGSSCGGSSCGGGGGGCGGGD